jgi:hypothetical protein
MELIKAAAERRDDSYCSDCVPIPQEFEQLANWNVCAGQSLSFLQLTMCNAPGWKSSEGDDDGDQSTWSREDDSDFSPGPPSEWLLSPCAPLHPPRGTAL